MTNEKKIYLFEEESIPKATATLAIPTVLSTLVMILYNLADTYFVGILNDPLESAAVTLAAPVLLAFNALINLFGVGTSSMMSRALGQKDYDTVKKSSAFGFYCALFSGILFSVLSLLFKNPLLSLLGAEGTTVAPTADYMFWTVNLGAAPAILNVVIAQMIRAEGSALHASVGAMSGCLLNIVLDPLFILPGGLNMGAAGAGCATFLSNCAACVYYLVLLAAKRDSTYVCTKPSAFRPTKKLIKAICAVGVPAAIQNLLNVTGMTILNNAMAQFGSEAVAAAGISHKTTMLPMYVSMGISQGVMPLVGYNYAAKNGKRMKAAILFAGKLSMGIMIAATATYYVLSAQIVRFFMSNPLIVEYGTAFTRGMVLAQPFLALDFLGVGVFQACGMGKRSFLFAILRKIVLEIPAMYLLNALWPMYGLAYSQLAAELLLAAASVFCLRNIFRKCATEQSLISKEEKA